MAADSTFNDTESSPRDPAEDAESSLAVHAPRPPRPSKRAPGLARIPMPAPAMRSGSGMGEPSVDDDAFGGLESEPASSAQRAAGLPQNGMKSAAEPEEEAHPEESFADLADRAPPAPLTPSRGMPAVAAPRRALDSSPAVSVSDDEDREDTTVGEVPRDLLELSGGGADECTRAYTAPQELIELAKRKREERLRAKAGAANVDDKASAEAHLRETQRPPGRGAAANDELVDLVPKAPRAVSDLGIGGPAASPRSSGRPSSSEALRAFSNSLRAPGWAAPGSDNEPASFERDSAPVVSAVKSRADVSPESLANLQATYKTPWLGGSRRWLLFVGFLFVIVGFAISRWSALSSLLFR